MKRRWEWSGVDEKERRVTKGVCGNEMSLMRPVECMYLYTYMGMDGWMRSNVERGCECA